MRMIKRTCNLTPVQKKQCEKSCDLQTGGQEMAV